MSKSGYEISWVTDHLAVAGAPLSYEAMNIIKAGGIDAILNLCAEYCDLHEIESQQGFAVHYLPIHDEKTPDIADLDSAMAWMDDIIRQNKKVLIHCRLGIGRTGTVLYAYLSSRGLKSKIEETALQKLRCRPANYCQCQLVQKYEKASGSAAPPAGSPGYRIRFMVSVSTFILLVLVALGSWAAIDIMEYADTSAIPHAEEKLIIIAPRQPFKSTVETLYRSGVITSPSYFYLYARGGGYARRIQAGEYQLCAAMTPRQILEVLASGKIFLHKVTIPEGYNLKDIAAAFDAAGLVSEAMFLQSAKDPQLCSRLNIKAGSAEGYLFPDTYSFPKGISVEKILFTMIQRFHQTFTPELVRQAEKEGLSIHQAVTLASIIEKETGADSERSLVSSVFHNRLRRNMRLESDPTVIYGMDHFNGNITRRDLTTPTPYNTYTRHGLPPGPIASPGAKSLLAAVYPADSDYLYFVSRKDKTHQFSRTFEDHLQAVGRYQLGGN